MIFCFPIAAQISKEAVPVPVDDSEADMVDDGEFLPLLNVLTTILVCAERDIHAILQVCGV